MIIKIPDWELKSIKKVSPHERSEADCTHKSDSSPIKLVKKFYFYSMSHKVYKKNRLVIFMYMTKNKIHYLRDHSINLGVPARKLAVALSATRPFNNCHVLKEQSTIKFHYSHKRNELQDLFYNNILKNGDCNKKIIMNL